jgi:hypothetical protein
VSVVGLVIVFLVLCALLGIVIGDSFQDYDR